METIRFAHEGDAKRLSALAEQTFVQTFAKDNTPEDMAEYCRTHFGEEIQRAELRDRGKSTVACEGENELIGYAQVRWGVRSDKTEDPSQAELQRIYLKGEWHGQGVAQRLMEFLLAQMKERGVRTVWLGVWEKNEKAIRFYRKFGFQDAGEHLFFLGSDRQRDLILQKELG